jgi:hypothetical protein
MPDRPSTQSKATPPATRIPRVRAVGRAETRRRVSFRFGRIIFPVDDIGRRISNFRRMIA